MRANAVVGGVPGREVGGGARGWVCGVGVERGGGGWGGVGGGVVGGNQGSGSSTLRSRFDLAQLYVAAEDCEREH